MKTTVNNTQGTGKRTAEELKALRIANLAKAREAKKAKAGTEVKAVVKATAPVAKQSVKAKAKVALGHLANYDNRINMWRGKDSGLKVWKYSASDMVDMLVEIVDCCIHHFAGMGELASLGWVTVGVVTKEEMVTASAKYVQFLTLGTDLDGKTKSSLGTYTYKVIKAVFDSVTKANGGDTTFTKIDKDMVRKLLNGCKTMEVVSFSDRRGNQYHTEDIVSAFKNLRFIIKTLNPQSNLTLADRMLNRF